jgi:dolichol-phosphate mannosyltransferase
VPAWRLRLSRAASQMYAVLCRHKLSCYTSCFRVYRRDAVAPVELENERFVGVAELMWKVLERGGRVVEHPAMLRSRVAGQSKMRVLRASLGHLGLMVKIVRTRFRRAG